MTKIGFAPFVLTTLCVELVSSVMYSAYASTHSQILGFYVLLTLWSIWRIRWVMSHYALAVAQSLFVLVMFATVSACVAMGFITGLTAIAIDLELWLLLSSWLSSAYDTSYRFFGIAADMLTLAELLSLFSGRMIRRDSGLGNIISAVAASLGVLAYSGALQRVQETKE